MWSGAGGITSTFAADNLTDHMAIGIYSNQDARFESLGGIAFGTDAVLLVPTPFGDANIDGLVNVTDLAALDNALVTPGTTGWQNGDFNYDGVIDRDNDYPIWIDSFFAQGNQVTPQISSLMAHIESAPVPEPAGGAVVIAAAAALASLGRRRRKRQRGNGAATGAAKVQE